VKYMSTWRKGDLGSSFHYFESRPVLQVILDGAGLGTLGIRRSPPGLVVSWCWGSDTALRLSVWDSVAVVIARVLGVSVPSFVLGPILQ